MAVAAALGLHAALVIGLPRSAGFGGKPAVAASAIAVRTLPAAAAVAVESSDAAPARLPERTVSEGARTATASVATAAVAMPASAPSRLAAVKSPLPPPRAKAIDEYRDGAGMDPGPQPLHPIDPVYPPEAGYQQGTVVLRVYIGDSGSVDGVQVVRSSPPGFFENSAVTAFAAAKFAPGRVLGVPVKSQITVEIAFAPVDRGGAVSGRGY